MAELIILREFLHRWEAERIKVLLEEHGIKSLLQADDCGGLRPEMIFGTAVKLKVTEEDLSEAQNIMNTFEN